MKKRENFGSKIGTILVAAGSAVGLGNIWRFPIETGQNGGAAYIFIYILCIIFLGYPVMMSEFIIGRHAHASTSTAFQKLSPGTQWKWVGRLGVLTGFVILGYYSVVSGWTLEYIYLTISNQFADKHTADFAPMFNDLVSNPWLSVMWTFVAFAITYYIIVRGVTGGIEKFSKILMPVLFLLITLLVVLTTNLPNADKGVDFLLNPDFSKINGKVVLSALGQAFYSLSLGMGALITYASYFNSTSRLRKTAINVCIIDTLVALMAGFIIFPAMFSIGHVLSPDEIGPSLIFITLPDVFKQSFSAVPILGYIFSLFFYILLFIAALTSMISLHEVATAYCVDERHIDRKKAALYVTLSCAILGALSALSFGPLKDFTIFGRTFFDLFDFTASNIFLPLGGLLTTIYVGWFINQNVLHDQVRGIDRSKQMSVKIIRFLIRYFAPIAIIGIFLYQFGII